VGRLAGKGPLGRPVHRQKDVINMDLQRMKNVKAQTAFI
jgi:hypothetical protein